MIALLIPTYNRVDRLEAVVENAATNTPDATVYLVMEPDEAADFPPAVTLTRPEGFGTYAKAINHAYRATDEPYIFCGADDLDFRPGWAEAALAEMKGEVRVVGTNDLGHPAVLAGDHATHYLIDRRYLDEVGGVYDQGPGSVLAECYDHNWTDTEFIQTARHRGVYTACLDSIVEHKHPAWGKASMDTTYGKSFQGADSDGQIAKRRLAAMAAE
jgi:hypothetical protein